MGIEPFAPREQGVMGDAKKSDDDIRHLVHVLFGCVKNSKFWKHRFVERSRGGKCLGFLLCNPCIIASPVSLGGLDLSLSRKRVNVIVAQLR